MRIPSSTSVTDRRLDWSAVSLLVLGVLLLVGSVPGSPLRSSSLELQVVVGLPAAVATVVYRRLAPSTPRWHLPLLFGWALLATGVALFVGFFLTMDTPGGYPGVVAEVVGNLVLFLAATAGLTGVYAAAARAGRLAPGVLLVAPGVQTILVAVVGTVT